MLNLLYVNHPLNFILIIIIMRSLIISLSLKLDTRNFHDIYLQEVIYERTRSQMNIFEKLLLPFPNKPFIYSQFC